MTLNYSPNTRYWYTPHQGYEARCQRRLKIDLGLDITASEAILHLRGQVVELQSQLRQLEAEIAAQSANQNLRLTQYHEFICEANWIELDFQE